MPPRKHKAGPSGPAFCSLFSILFLESNPLGFSVHSRLARYDWKAATAQTFRNSDSQMSVPGSTNWKSSRLQVVVAKLSHYS